MITIISPAKIFRELPEGTGKCYTPLVFHEQSVMLIEILKAYSQTDLASLMKMSDALAKLNLQRYQSFEDIAHEEAYEALMYFHGEAYKGLEAESLSDEAKSFIHEHICILSGLYGTIKPLECIKPYRLEMGTKLINPVGKDLYVFWREHLTQAVLKAIASTGGEQVLINLASDEYSKVLNLKEISQTYPVIQVSFKEKKGDTYKVVGMYAKRARGRMVRYIGEGAIDTVEGIKGFDEEGYALNDELSSATHLVFTREQA